MADKLHDEARRIARRRVHESERPLPAGAAELVEIGVDAESGRVTEATRRVRRTATSPTASHRERTIRSTAPVYRWVCPCQDPPVLLATYGPNARINIKVRDRYWHLQGFGMVEAICPRCAAEHMLDMRLLRSALEAAGQKGASGDDDRDELTID